MLRRRDEPKAGEAPPTLLSPPLLPPFRMDTAEENWRCRRLLRPAPPPPAASSSPPPVSEEVSSQLEREGALADAQLRGDGPKAAAPVLLPLPRRPQPRLPLRAAQTE